MKIKSRLRRILIEHGFDHHGIIGEISDALKVHRHTIAKLYNGDAVSLRLDVLGELAEWLMRKGVPGTKLPHELIGPDALWDHIRRSKKVMIYLGEYEPGGPQRLARSMISRHDAGVATDLVQHLVRHDSQREVDISYVAMRDAAGGASSVSVRDREEAKYRFEEMRSRESDAGSTSAFLIGSQKINFMVEELVATTFGFRPFESTASDRFVPFYLLYRERDPLMPSCFGGGAPPPKFKGRREPGIYYMTAEGWNSCLYREGHQDAGIVITTHQRANNAVEVALFGFSSASTASVGTYFLENADQFWPPTADVGGREVGVYVCRFSYTDGNMWGKQKFQCKVDRIDDKILAAAGAHTQSGLRRKKRSPPK